MGKENLRAFPGKLRQFFSRHPAGRTVKQAIYISPRSFVIRSGCFSLLNFRCLLFVIARAITPLGVDLFIVVVVVFKSTASKLARAVSSRVRRQCPKFSVMTPRKAFCGSC